MHLDKILTKELLIKKLIAERVPIMELSVELNCCKHTIIKYCKKHNIYEIIKEKRVSNHHNDITGNVYGKLTVIDRATKSVHGHTRWNCICECGKTKIVNLGSLTRGLTKSCGFCTKYNFKGYKDISYTYLKRLEKAACERYFEYKITPEYIWEIYEKQNRKCIFTNLEVIFYKNPDKQSLQTASVDRINSDIGYIEGNIQIVHKRINLLKGSLKDEDLLYFCGLIYKNNIEKCENLLNNHTIDWKQRKNWQ